MRDKRFRVTSLALMLLVFGLATSALAVVTTYTWSSVLADSWSTSLAWTPAGPPGAADTVVFDATSDAACVINGGAVTCGVLWLNSGAGTVTIKAGGSLTCDKFTQSAGTFVDNGGTLTSHGDLLVTGGRFTSTGSEVMDGTGNLNDSIAANAFANLTVAGTGTIVATLTGTVCANALTIGAADSVKGAYTMRMRPATNNFISIGSGGSLSGGGLSVTLTTDATLAAVTIGEALTINASSIADSLTLTGALSVKGLTFATGISFVDGGYAVTTAGDLLVGDTSVAIHSTGTWTQSASGTVKNRDTANAFHRYVVSDAGAGSIKVTVDSSSNSLTCRRLSIGQNDTIANIANGNAIVIPDSNDFISAASGAAIQLHVVSIYLSGGVLRQGTFTADANICATTSMPGCSLLATGTWNVRTLTIQGAAPPDSQLVVDMNDNILLADTFFMEVDSLAGTFLAGNATHVVYDIWGITSTYSCTVDLESCNWRAHNIDFSDKITVISTGARMWLQTGIAPSAWLSVNTLPAIVCSTVTSKPIIYGGVGRCSTLVVSAVCIDTVFMDTTDTGDTIKVLSQFLANGTRGSTFLYGLPTSRTDVQFPTNSYAHDVKIANVRSVNRQTLKAYGCVPKGHNSGIVFGG
jgi:hypothetical protein